MDLLPVTEQVWSIDESQNYTMHYLDGCRK